MFERFTDQARQVVVLAQEEARLMRHGHIAPSTSSSARAHRRPRRRADAACPRAERREGAGGVVAIVGIGNAEPAARSRSPPQPTMRSRPRCASRSSWARARRAAHLLLGSCASATAWRARALRSGREPARGARGGGRRLAESSHTASHDVRSPQLDGICCSRSSSATARSPHGCASAAWTSTPCGACSANRR